VATADSIYVDPSASAVELELKYFVTFDLRQQKLARAAALKLILPAEG
jgi:hypothetical protein